MYWQKRFDLEDPDAKLTENILAIYEQHKNYDYRCMEGELTKCDFIVNKYA